jgi:2Fe-2S ferredoxin
MSNKKKTPQPAVTFQPGNRSVPIGAATSVLEVALQNHIDLSHSCGGMGSCTTCRVWVESETALLSPRTELEQEIASSRNFDPRERLACQLEPHDGLVVRIPDEREG